METQKFMGANQMLDRLAAQIGDRDKAVQVLIARGHMEADGKTWTPAGAARNAMTAEERAIDRAKTAGNHPAKAYTYDPNTNRATLKFKRR